MSAAAEAAYFDGNHCQHVATRDEHQRLARIDASNRRALALNERRKDWRCSGCGHVNWTVRKPARCIAFDDCAGKMEPLR